jgi:hypothetical protein
MLQEAEISTLSPEECAEYGKKMKVEPEFEICGGRKIQKLAPKIFERQSENKFKEVEQKNETDSKGFILGQFVNNSFKELIHRHKRIDRVLIGTAHLPCFGFRSYITSHLLTVTQ